MFTKEDAVAAGWTFVQAAEGTVEDLGDGISRTTLPIHRAEKYVRSKLVNQTAHSEDGLVAAIEDYEAHLQARDPESAGAPAVPISEGVVAAEGASDMNPGDPKLGAIEPVVDGDVAEPVDPNAAGSDPEPAAEAAGV
jgi:hypothetical protein